MFCNKRILVYSSVHTIWITLGFRVSRSLHQQQIWQPLLPSPNITQRWWNTSALSPISVVTHCTSHQLVISLPNTTRFQQCSDGHSLLTVKRLSTNEPSYNFLHPKPMQIASDSGQRSFNTCKGQWFMSSSHFEARQTTCHSCVLVSSFCIILQH